MKEKINMDEIIEISKELNLVQKKYIDLNKSLEEKTNDYIMECYDLNKIEELKTLYEIIPQGSIQMKIGSIISHLEKENEIADSKENVEKESIFKKELDELSIRILKSNDEEQSVIEKLRMIEAASNDSLDNVLRNVGNGYSIDEMIYFKSIRSKRVFVVNGLIKENKEKIEKFTINEALFLIDNLKSQDTTKKEYSITTVG